MSTKGNLHHLFNAVQKMPQVNYQTSQGLIAGLHPDFDRKGKIVFRIATFDIKGNKKSRYVGNFKAYNVKEAERRLHEYADKLGWKKVSWNEN